MKYDGYQIKTTDRILYIRLSAIGDVVNAIPGFVALRKSFPNNFIAWCVEDTSADLLKNHPMIDELIVLKYKWRKNLLAPDTIAEMRETIRKIRELKFDVVIDAHNLLKSGLVAWLSRAPIRVGPNHTYNTEGYKRFLNVLVDSSAHEPNLDKRLWTAARQRAGFLKHLGVEISDETVSYVLPPLDRQEEEVRQILATNGISPDERVVVLNARASRYTKEWPGPYFAEVGQALAEKYAVRIVWTGSRGDRTYIEPLVAAMTTPSLNLAGELSLDQLAALLRRANLLISGDTGPLHIGAAVGTYVIALMGSTDPKLHGPYTLRKTVLTAGLDCQYCAGKTCEKQVECLQRIKPSEVIEKVDALIRAGEI